MTGGKAMNIIFAYFSCTLLRVFLPTGLFRFIQKSLSIFEAFKLLDETANKVLLVVDNENRLLGALTDGDIRRYLLSGRSLEGTIAEVYNKNPKYIVEKEYTRERAKKIFLKFKISLLPIIDEEKKLINVVSWDAVFSEKGTKTIRKIKKIKVPVVIMAGGKGTRLDPFTKIMPKPLIPIGDKPIIELIMDKFHEFGMDDFYVTLNHKSKMIKAYFEEFKTKYKITFIDENKPLGTAGGLKYLPASIQGPIFVSNSDILIEEDYRNILQFHKDNRNETTIVASVKNYNIPYGVCEIENGGTLREIKEKPNISFLVNTGMYVVNASVLQMIPEGKFYHITQLMEDIKCHGKRIGVFPISENSWMDVGEWEKYKEVSERFKA
jgi:dTDP-glucose pyrophosphorylase